MPFSNGVQNQEKVLKRIQIHRQQIQQVRAKAGYRLENACSEAQQLLNDVEGDLLNPRPTTIALVGETGSGKSTLINALASARVLPVGNMSACTSAVTELSFADQEHFSAEVTFVSREDWNREIEHLRMDIQDKKTYRDEEPETREDEGESPSHAALKKIKVIYGEGFDLNQLREPEEVTALLDCGSKTFEFDDVEDLWDTSWDYLSSQGMFWPLVQCVKIRGPFPNLQNGVVLVDLPGLNDPNEAREHITKEYIKNCRYIWIVFAMKRALTRNIFDFMQNGGFLEQVVMDGRSNSLTLVGTGSDEFDRRGAIKELGLGKNATNPEIVHARNTKVHQIIKQQLQELAESMAGNAIDEDKNVNVVEETLKNAFQASGVFPVSAKAYLHLERISDNPAGPIDHVQDTGISELVRHMQDISRAHGPEERLQAAERRIDFLLNSLRQELQTHKIVVEQSQMNQQQLQEVREADKASRRFLKEHLNEDFRAYAAQLKASQHNFDRTLDLAIERGKNALENVHDQWSGIYWSTFRATMRRGGTFVSSSGRKFDFSGDIAAPVLEGLAFAWSEFFSKNLVLQLKEAKLQLQTKASDFGNQLWGLANQHGFHGDFLTTIERMRQTSNEVLEEFLRQIERDTDERISTVQRTLYEQIRIQIHSNMQEAYAIAAQESGRGVRQRMLNIVAQHSLRVTDVMFRDARKELGDGIAGLVHWLKEQHKEMAIRVYNHAKTLSDSLLQDFAMEGRDREQVLADLQTAIEFLEAERD